MTYLVLGGCHIDERLIVEKLDAGQSTPARSKRSIGGVAFNVAHAIGSTGAQADTAFICGDDANGSFLTAELASRNMTAPQVIKDQRTGRYIAIENQAGKLLYGLADMEIYNAYGQAFSSICKCRDVILDTNPSADFFSALVDAKTKSIHLVVTSPTKLAYAELILPYVTNLFLNKDEAKVLLPNETDSKSLVTKLKKLGPERVILTDSSNPVICATDAGVWQSPAPRPLKHQQSHTGLGDRFAGLTLAQLADKQTLEQAVTQALENL